MGKRRDGAGHHRLAEFTHVENALSKGGELLVELSHGNVDGAGS
jgi:hypothetical protein